MNHLIRNTLLALAIGATALASATPSLADGWRRPYYGPPPVERRHHGGDAAALGVIGLATGLIVGSAIASSHQNDGPVYEPYPVDPYRRAPAPAPYYDNPDRVYYPAAPRRVAVPDYRVQTLEPWTPAWQDYCASRYRSFDPASGTYAGYDGNRHFCTAG